VSKGFDGIFHLLDIIHEMLRVVHFIVSMWKWTISKRIKSQLEAAEMWFLRRVLRIAWASNDKVSNEQVLVWYGMVWYGIVEFNVPLDTV